MGESNAALGKCKEESAARNDKSLAALPIDVVSVRTLGVQYGPIAGGNPHASTLQTLGKRFSLRSRLRYASVCCERGR